MAEWYLFEGMGVWQSTGMWLFVGLMGLLLLAWIAAAFHDNRTPYPPTRPDPREPAVLTANDGWNCAHCGGPATQEVTLEECAIGEARFSHGEMHRNRRKYLLCEWCTNRAVVAIDGERHS